MKTLAHFAIDIQRDMCLELSGSQFEALITMLQSDPEAETKRLWELRPKQVMIEINKRMEFDRQIYQNSF
jgi:hypothetical protein